MLKSLFVSIKNVNLILFCILLLTFLTLPSYSSQVENNSSEPGNENSIPVSNANNTSNKNSNKTATVSKKSQESKKTSKSNSKAYDKEKICYLTFDDGPSERTLEILKILKEYEVKATFFVIASKKNEYLKQIANEGHAIGLHSYLHDYKKIYKSEKAFFDDLDKISDVVKKETGLNSKVIRFPGGTSNQKAPKGMMKKIAKSATDKGYVYFDWNCDTKDSWGNNVKKKDIIKSLKETYKNPYLKQDGRVCVLMHDSLYKKTTVKALPDIIKFFKKEGYTFEILTEETTPIQHSPAK